MSIFCVSYVLSVISVFYFFFFFKQKTAYEMRISDWSSDVCSSDLLFAVQGGGARFQCLQPGLGLFDLAAGVFDSLWRRSGHAQSFRRVILIAPDPTERKRGRAHLCKLAFACVRGYP